MAAKWATGSVFVISENDVDADRVDMETPRFARGGLSHLIRCKDASADRKLSVTEDRSTDRPAGRRVCDD